MKGYTCYTATHRFYCEFNSPLMVSADPTISEEVFSSFGRRRACISNLSEKIQISIVASLLLLLSEVLWLEHQTWVSMLDPPLWSALYWNPRSATLDWTHAHLGHPLNYNLTALDTSGKNKNSFKCCSYRITKAQKLPPKSLQIGNLQDGPRPFEQKICSKASSIGISPIPHPLLKMRLNFKLSIHKKICSFCFMILPLLRCLGTARFACGWQLVVLLSCGKYPPT